MKKLYKRVNSKRLTIESMYTCSVKCSKNCVDCGTACGGDPSTGIALLNVPAIRGYVDESLVAIGSAVG